MRLSVRHVGLLDAANPPAVKGALADRPVARDRAVSELVAASAMPDVLVLLDAIGKEQIGQRAGQPRCHRDYPVLAALAADHDELPAVKEAVFRS